MGETPRQSPVHLIIGELTRAVEALRLGVPPLFVERWGVVLHQALASRAREFHTPQHALDLCVGADPLEAIAALYHDTVYVQVDLGLPEHFTGVLVPLIRKEAAGWRVLPHAGVDAVSREVLAVFGRHPGEVLTPLSGLNELASALVVTKEFEGILSRSQLLALAAAIEGTIPFREDQGDALAVRLLGLGLTGAETADMVRRAVRLSNSDVGNFAHPDPNVFLENTWKLLPETNPALHMPSTYAARDYRVALEKMEEFLAQLKPERVFRAWGGEPAPAEHTRRVTQARTNIELAVRYLRCKLYASALIEALAAESGGDGPLELFLGGAPEPGGPPMVHLGQFLSPPSGTQAVDPLLQGLLDAQRTATSSFETSPSPIAGYLCLALGEPAMRTGIALAKAWWRGERTARDFLRGQPFEVVELVARATGQVAPTRLGALEALMAALAAAPAPPASGTR